MSRSHSFATAIATATPGPVPSAPSLRAASWWAVGLVLLLLVGCSAPQPRLDVFAPELPHAQAYNPVPYLPKKPPAPAALPALPELPPPPAQVASPAAAARLLDLPLNPPIYPASAHAQPQRPAEPVAYLPVDASSYTATPAFNDPLASAAPAAPAASAPELLAQGRASWYGPGFHGRRTASGERFDMHALTAAHKTLPLGSRVRVRSVHTGKEVVVRINDRGPYKNQRIIDLSYAAAKALGVKERGVTEVLVLRE
jgi:rare lipoprotein A